MDRILRFAAAATPVLLSAVVALAGGAARAAIAYPPYPHGSKPADVGQWLASQTDLPLPSVVLVGPGYVFSFQTPDPPTGAGGLVWKSIREEVTSLVMESRLGGRSATASIAFDCARNQATASDVVVYPGNSLQGQAGRSVPAADWLTANPGFYLMDLAQAACSPAYRRPFAISPVSTSTISGAAAAPPRQEAGPEHWVQVGAFASPAAASQRWREIQRQLPAQSAGRGVRVEPAGIAGKSLVRALVGPFHGAAPAQAFCAALKLKGGDCLVR